MTTLFATEFQGIAQNFIDHVLLNTRAGAEFSLHLMKCLSDWDLYEKNQFQGDFYSLFQGQMTLIGNFMNKICTLALVEGKIDSHYVSHLNSVVADFQERFLQYINLQKKAA